MKFAPNPCFAPSLALLATAALCAPPGSAQSPRTLHNGGDVAFIYSDPSSPAGSADLFWMVYPRQTLIAPSGSVELTTIRFELYDSDYTTSPVFYDLLFGPGATNANGVIEPDFSPAGMLQSTLVIGGPSGLPNPCVVSPSLCTSTSGCPVPGFLVGYQVSISFGPCGGTGLVLPANNTVDNVVTAFLPRGMTFSSGPPGPCGGGDYTIYTYSTDEQQADTLATLPGASRYSGFQLGSAPGLNPDAVTERPALALEFCEPMVNTTIGGDPGTVGLHVAAIGGPLALQQVVADARGLGEHCFVACSLAPPLAAPGIPWLGAGAMLNPGDPFFFRTLKNGPVAPAPPAYMAAFVPEPLVLPALPAAVALVISSQALIVNPATQLARATPVTQTRVNH